MIYTMREKLRAVQIDVYQLLPQYRAPKGGLASHRVLYNYLKLNRKSEDENLALALKKGLYFRLGIVFRSSTDEEVDDAITSVISLINSQAPQCQQKIDAKNDALKIYIFGGVTRQMADEDLLVAINVDGSRDVFRLANGSITKTQWHDPLE